MFVQLNAILSLVSRLMDERKFISQAVNKFVDKFIPETTAKAMFTCPPPSPFIYQCGGYDCGSYCGERVVGSVKNCYYTETKWYSNSSECAANLVQCYYPCQSQPNCITQVCSTCSCPT